MIMNWKVLTRFSICKEYWQFVLAQGIVCGIGFGLLFTPSIAIIPQYFVVRLREK